MEGGSKGELATTGRRVFGKLFEKLGIERKPRVVMCGARSETYKTFKDALKDKSREALLLVDSEKIVTGPPWAHVKEHDGWEQPKGATDDELHFMAVVMETWCVAALDSATSGLEKRTKEKIFEQLSPARSMSLRRLCSAPR